MTTTSASGLPITQLGSTIKAHMGTAEKYEGKAEEHYKAAGLHLIEAKARIASGEFGQDFKGFLMFCCNGLSPSRAYELIAIASGTQTVDGVRKRAREGMQRSRAAAATVRNVSEKAKGMAQAVTPGKTAMTKPAAEDTHEQAIILQIAAACRSQPLEKLKAILAWAKAAPPPKLTPAQQETADGLTRHLKKVARQCTAEGIRDELKQALYDAAMAACPD